MYVVAPALPPPYKWLQIPLSALHTDRWPGYLSTWPIRQGGSNQMFSGELKAFLRGSGVRNTTHWPLVFLATATVVTSAVALYYYASTPVSYTHLTLPTICSV